MEVSCIRGNSAGSVVEFFLFTFLCSRTPADAIHLFHAGRANHQILCRQWVYVKESHGKQTDCQKCRCTGNFYKAICQVVLQQDYVSADETYHKVLLAKTKPTDKGSKKGYFWAVSAPKLGLVFFVYEDGSRSEQVILNVFSDYKGTIQSDAYAPYRKLESDAYPDIMRIACLQHVKRDFIDCGKEDKDAQKVVDILNRFYREDKSIRLG